MHLHQSRSSIHCSCLPVVPARPLSQRCEVATTVIRLSPADPIKNLFRFELDLGFLQQLLPSTIGGNLYRVLYLTRRFSARPAEVVSAVILDRGLGLLAMLSLATLAGLLFLGTSVQSLLGLLAVFVVLSLIALVGCVIKHLSSLRK
jgi:hypothetical protein